MALPCQKSNLERKRKTVRLSKHRKALLLQCLETSKRRNRDQIREPIFHEKENLMRPSAPKIDTQNCRQSIILDILFLMKTSNFFHPLKASISLPEPKSTLEALASKGWMWWTWMMWGINLPLILDLKQRRKLKSCKKWDFYNCFTLNILSEWPCMFLLISNIG